jgi:hypothetical protein
MGTKTETPKGKVIRQARNRAKAALQRAVRELSIASGIYEGLNGRYESPDPKAEVEWKVRNRLEDPLWIITDCLRSLSSRKQHRFGQESNFISTLTRNETGRAVIDAEKIGQ